MATNSILSFSEKLPEAFDYASKKLYSAAKSPSATINVPKFSATMIKPYDGPGYPNTPSIINLFYIPGDLLKTVYAIVKANFLHDKEAKFDAWLRLYGILHNPISSVCLTLDAVYQVDVFLHPLHVPYHNFSKIAAIPGIILCGIEGVFESVGAYRNWTFLNAMNGKILEEIPDLRSIGTTAQKEKVFLSWAAKFEKQTVCLEEKIGKEPVAQILQALKNFRNGFAKMPEKEKADCFARLQQSLDQFKLRLVQEDLAYLKTKYFSLSPEKGKLIENQISKKHQKLSQEEARAKKEKLVSKTLQTQQTSLARRIRPFLVKEVEEKIDAIEKGLRSYNPKERQSALEKGQELLKNVKVQTEKKIYVHITGIVAVALTIIGLVLLFTSCPYIIPFLLIFIGGALAMARYFMAYGLLDHKGWEMDYKNCLPNWIRKRFFDPPADTKAHSSYDPLYYRYFPAISPFAQTRSLSDHFFIIIPPEHSTLFRNTFNLKTAVGPCKHSQKVKATPAARDSWSKDCAFLPASTAVFRFKSPFFPENLRYCL